MRKQATTPAERAIAAWSEVLAGRPAEPDALLAMSLLVDGTLMFMDATHPQHNPVISYGWIKRGKEHPIKSNTGRRRLNINGAINIERMSAEIRFDDTIDAISTIALFRQIESANPLAKRITIIGDFDVDGATSTALVLRCLRAFGFADVDYLVPNRFDYGYGLTPEIDHGPVGRVAQEQAVEPVRDDAVAGLADAMGQVEQAPVVLGRGVAAEPGQPGAAAQFENVPFDKLVRMLADIERRGELDIVDVSVTRRGVGTVNASLSLKSAP